MLKNLRRLKGVVWSENSTKRVSFLLNRMTTMSVFKTLMYVTFNCLIVKAGDAGNQIIFLFLLPTKLKSSKLKIPDAFVKFTISFWYQIYRFWVNCEYFINIYCNAFSRKHICIWKGTTKSGSLKLMCRNATLFCVNCSNSLKTSNQLENDINII